MGSEAEHEPSSIPKLPLFTIPLPPQSPERSGTLTPPLQTSATVPFRWEEEPGKPLHCTALVPATTAEPNNYCLELPPRLQITDSKMPSPNTVLDGPYLGISLFQSSSFRFRRERQGSFGSSCGSPERGLLGAMVLNKRERMEVEESKERGGGLFGSWGRKSGKRQVGEGSFVFPSSSMDLADFGGGGEEGGGGGGSRRRKKMSRRQVGEGSFVFSSSSMDFADFGGGEEEGGDGGGGRGKKMSRIRRNGSRFSSFSKLKSHFWATIYDGFKQVLPWKSRKSKKEGLII